MPVGVWPEMMTAATAAAYMDECSVEAFLRRVGSLYPTARNISGRGRVWLKKDLDRTIVEIGGEEADQDAASLL
jgi:hypothetical protein